MSQGQTAAGQTARLAAWACDPVARLGAGPRRAVAVRIYTLKSKPVTDEKPVGEALGWQRLSTARLYRSRWHNLRQDTVRLAGSEVITYTYQEHPGFVTIVPVTADGQVVMIRTYRYTVDDWCWEVPAGGLGDKPGMTPEEVARQELAEETGCVCQSMELVGWFYPMNGTSDSICHLFLAKGVEARGGNHLEATELIEVHRVPLAQAFQMARDGRITDGDSALALLRCEPLLRTQHRIIEVVPPDPRWPELFRVEAARLAQVFADQLISIHHMGSTAVPGLWAKPVIDILPIVRDIEAVDDHNELMIALGYQPKGEYGIPGRRFFSLDDACGRRLFNVHAYQAGNPEIARHLDFVAYLRAHPEDAAAYARLKRALAEQFYDDIDSYVAGKTDLIRQIEAKIPAWKGNVQ